MREARVRRSLHEIEADSTALQQLNMAFYEAGRNGLFERFAKIHGAPCPAPSYSLTYCHHGTVLFPTWHRAYLLNLEEDIRKMTGFENFCLPYFDQTSSEAMNNGLPRCLTDTEADIGGGHRVPNPLRSFSIASGLVINANTVIPKGTSTSRAGTEDVVHYNQAYVKAISDINTQMKSCLEGSDFPAFATQAVGSDSGSVEEPHGNLHVLIGYGSDFFSESDPWAAPDVRGKMLDRAMRFVPVSSYDPIFFFHHCNIDRLYYIWQIRHGIETWVPPQDGDTNGYNPSNIRDMEGVQILDMNTPLKPFQKPDGSFWTSHSVQGTAHNVYSYSVGSHDPRSTRPVLATLATPALFHVGLTLDKKTINGPFSVHLFGVTNPMGNEQHVGVQHIFSDSRFVVS